MFTILDKKKLAPEIYSMKVLAPRVAQYAEPGQFVIIIPDEKGERIPLTICDFSRNAGWVVIVFQVVGLTTRKMGQFKIGDSFADFVGPLGQASEIIHKKPDELYPKNILFVAGGVGAAPVYPQVKWLSQHSKKPDLILGSKSCNHLILLPELKQHSHELFIATNDGSAGIKGFVTTILEQVLITHLNYYDLCIAIGPMIMMKSVADLTRKFNLKTIVSLNTLMIDGTGMCGACRVSVGTETKFTCVDGPEFDGHLVNFEEAMRRQGMYKYEEYLNDHHNCTIDKAIELSHR